MIDCHCHLQAAEFGNNFDDIMGIGIAKGIQKWVVNGTRESDWQQVAAIARQYPEHIVPCFGLHPWYLSERTESWEQSLMTYLEEFPAAGVGEIGLDRWMKDFDDEDQAEVFARQWAIAHELKRPLSVHCLRAWGQLMKVLPGMPEHPFLLHSYSGSRELAQQLLANHKAVYFSISGYFFAPSKYKKLEVFKAIPIERLLVETDAPAMALPQEYDLYPDSPYNHPANLEVVYRSVGEFVGVSTAELSAQISSNYHRWVTL